MRIARLRPDKLKFRTARSRKIAYAAVLAATAMLPTAARASEAPPPRVAVERAATALPLPALPYLETTPWLSWEPYRHGLKVDTLLLPASPLKHGFNGGHWLRNPLELPTS